MTTTTTDIVTRVNNALTFDMNPRRRIIARL
jgi:hypothetical protein